MHSCWVDACIKNASVPYVDPDLFAVSAGLSIDLDSSRSGLLRQWCVKESIVRVRGNPLKQSGKSLTGSGRCRMDVPRGIPKDMTSSCPIEVEAPRQFRVRFVHHQLAYLPLALTLALFPCTLKASTDGFTSRR